MCGVNLYDVKLCDVNLCDVNLCDVNLCDVKLCDVNLCDVNLCDVKLCDVNLCDVNLCGVNLCDVKLCDVNLCAFNLCDVNLCDVNLCDVKLCDVNLCDVNLCDVNLCDVKLCDVNLCDVNLCDVKLCDVNLCDVNLCDFNLCDVNLCDVNLCDVKLCDVNLCDVKLCDVSVRVCDVSVRVCDVNLCGVCLCDVNLCNANLCAQLPQTQFTHSKAPNPHASKTSTQNFRISYWHSYPKRNLHTARRQTRMPARHPHKIFAPIGTATPNAIYTQQGTKPACQQDIHTNFSHLLLAQLPRTQFTHSAPPNPHASRTKIFAPPIGAATPNAIYTEHAAKPACQQDINAKFSHLLLAQLPRTQFTHSKLPNPHARKTSTQNFRISYCDSFSERNLHTSCRRSKSHACHAKAAAEQRRPRSAKAYIRPPAVQQAPRLPRESSGRAAETKKRQSVHQTPCSAASPTPATRKQRQSSGDQGAPKRTSDPLQRSKPHACHAKAAAEQRRPRRAKAYIRPPAAVQQVPRLPRESSGSAAEERQSVHQTPCSAVSPTPATSAKAYIRPPAVQQAPRLPRESKGRAAETKERQSVHVPRLPRESSGSPAETKERQSVHQTPCSAASPTPATRKQRQRSGDQGAPKRTSDPLQRSKPHACHAKAGAEQRRPRSAKAYIRPPAAQQAPRLPRKSRGRAAETKERQSVHQTPCSAASPTPATRKQRQSSGDQGAPKRTSDPLQVLQVPRLPRESRGRAAETKERQSVHQTPCSAASPTPATRKQRQSSGDQGAPKRTSDPLQCSKSHACHAKAAAEQRRPRSAKAYVRPPAVQQVPRLPRKSRGRAAETKERQSVHQTPCSAASPTPATRKQRQPSGDQGAPKRTSDPLQVLQVPRLPRESRG